MESQAERRGRPIPFVVFTAPRSGSSWLVELLHGHPRIEAYAELFLPGDRTTPGYGGRDLPRFEAVLAARRRRGPALLRRIAYLNRVFAHRPGVDAVGFKLMYGHPEVHPGLLPYLALRRVRAVQLVRANLLDQVLSWETAVARQQFRARRGERVEPVAVRLEPGALVERLERLERANERGRRTLRRYRLPALEVEYGRLRASTEDELARITTFLGVAPAPREVEPEHVRMNRTQRELLENADEVEAALAGTRFEWMLEPPRRTSPASA